MSGLPFIASASCPSQGEWWQQGQSVPNSELLAQAATHQVVLLGEQHDAMDHHRWQLSTLAGLYALRDDMVIGLEMLPRDAQPALDAWVAGTLTEDDLLKQTRWQDVWGFDPALYLPIFHFARLQNIPLIALNITPELRQRLTTEGFSNVPADQRHHIPAPIAASDSYESRLTTVFNYHPAGNDDPQQLTRFINAQLSWDVAMAHGLAQQAEQGYFAVGLMGLGHVIYKEGVAHQLTGVGIDSTFSLLPWSVANCQIPDPSFADAVFILEAE